MQSGIRIEEYDYKLEESRIAKYPLQERDVSRLLFDDGTEIHEHIFRDLPRLLPGNSAIVFNDTRVFHARLLFRKDSGALIEIFCLEPVGMDFQQSFASFGDVEWICLIGNARRWKSGPLRMNLRIRQDEVMLIAERSMSDKGQAVIRFHWDSSGISFGELIEVAGSIPIPPYLKRDAEEGDKRRYQTQYARTEGSVAAPTAGLHFTESVLKELDQLGIAKGFLTLHVGAGTFKPVVTETIDSHEMHPEHFSLSTETLRWLIGCLEQRKHIVAVGTTTVRTLESLYWMGIDSYESIAHQVGQWRPYTFDEQITTLEALRKILGILEFNGLDHLEGITRLMIRPGYRFRIVSGMVTNFHQPKSTLLLLVAAMIGARWRQAYEFALTRGFRFLSYGDSCLFLPGDKCEV